MDLTERVADHRQRDERRAELDKREREHGGLIPSDRETEARKRSVAGWGPYRPDVTRAEAKQARQGILPDDPRRVTIQRLYVDCGAAVRRFAPKYRRSAADTLRNDTLLLLLRWPRHGDARSLDLGGDGGTPLRRDWLEPTELDGRAPREKLTALAWRALRAAVKQAADAPALRELMADDELPADPHDIAAAVEAHQLANDAATRLPDVSAPEVLADALSVPLDAARAIVARAFPAATADDLARSWGVAPASLKVALSRGAAQVRQRYPNPVDLLDALDGAAETVQRRAETDALVSLIRYRDGELTESGALAAVSDWRGAEQGMSDQRRALLAAARVATARAGGSYGSERAERIARSLPRLMGAEQRRGSRRATLGARGSHASGARDSASALPLSRWRKPVVRPAAPMPMVGEPAFPKQLYGDGYSGACSCLYLYRSGGRR